MYLLAQPHNSKLLFAQHLIASLNKYESSQRSALHGDSTPLHALNIIKVPCPAPQSLTFLYFTGLHPTTHFCANKYESLPCRTIHYSSTPGTAPHNLAMNINYPIPFQDVSSNNLYQAYQNNPDVLSY